MGGTFALAGIAGCAILAFLSDLRWRRVAVPVTAIALVLAGISSPVGLLFGVALAGVLTALSSWRLGGADIAWSGVAGALSPLGASIGWLALALGVMMFRSSRPERGFPAAAVLIVMATAAKALGWGW